MNQTHSVILALIVLGFYFLPALVAAARKHRQRGAILALNLLLGWTFIGWVIALVWAFTAAQPAPTVIIQNHLHHAD